MKANDVISGAARLAGILASGETLQGNEPADCLAILQQMMDAWQADGLRIYAEGINKFPLVIGKQVYTLGPANTDFIMTRPAKIQRMGIEMTGSSPSQPPEVPISVLDSDGWAAIRVKNIQGGYPLNCFPDYQYPNMNLSFYQIPGLACNVVIYAWNPLLSWNDLNITDINFPPAYAQAIKYNLAINLAAEFKTTPDPVVLGIASQTLAQLKEVNLPAPILVCDGGLNTRSGYYDWRSDSYVERR